MLERTGWRRAISGALISIVTAIGLVGALVQPAAAASGTPVAVTKYSHTSATGDYIGGGESKSYTPATADISVSGGASELTFQVRSTSGEWWYVELAAPRGENLHRGVYYNAERAVARTGTSPGLDVWGEGRGCSQLWGQFAINQIETDADGNITVLDASYTQRCESATAPPLKGTVKWHAYPLSYAFQSDAGDWLGGGVSKSYTGSTTNFGIQPYGDRGLQFDVSGRRDEWSGLIMPPEGQELTAGTTYQVDGAEGAASLSFGGNGRGCAATGDFTVKKLARNADGTIKAIALTFTQYCDGGAAALHGTFRYYA